MVSLNATENKQFWMILLQKRRMHSNTAPNPVFDGAPSPKGRHHAQKLSYGPASQPAMHRSDPPSVPSPATAPLRAIAPPHSATPRSSPYPASPALPPSISSRSPSPSPLASPSPSVPSPLQTRPSPQPSHGNIISPPAYIPSPSSTVPAYIPSPSSTVPKARIPSAVVRAPPYPSATTTPSFSPGPLAQRSPGTTPVSSPIPLSKFSHPTSSYLEPSTGVSSSVSSAINFSEKHVSAAGITAIAVAGIIVVVVVGFFIWYRKKRKDEYGDYRGPSSGSFSYKSGGMYVSERGPWPDNSSSSSQYPIRSLTLPSTSSGSVNGYNGVNGSVGGCALGVSQPRNASLGPGMGNWKSWFTYEELIVATNGFSRENLLGEGAFGRVYKGYMQDGQVVAVKQLKVGGHQGECEFRAEVEIIGRVHHRHLVSLVGYCIADSQRLLVYEYVPNGTLEHHLHEKGKLVIDWATRLKIAIGAARGLAYLHEDCHPRIIHRDIKSANILLDNNFEAQVSDFGLAKLAPDTYTHVTTCVVGTFGYLAPEYASSGKLSERSDVYSFGVLLLELVTGQRPIDTSRPIGNESLIEWARPLLNRALEDGEVESLADPKLGNNFDVDEMLCMVKAAAACVRHSAERRPRMGQVVRALENDVGNPDLSNGVKPGDSSRYDPAFIRTFYMMAFGNQEYGSEYNEEISDYGLNPYL